MEPKPDTNSDFNYPPLTNEQMDELFAFYQHDGTQMRASNGSLYDVTINFPISAPWVYEKLGHRVVLLLSKSDAGEQAKPFRTLIRIERHTPETALGQIKSFVEQASNTPTIL